jgi:hypothetical protein
MPRTRRSYRALLAALLVLAPLRITAAQTAAAQSLSPGTRVRVTSNQMVAPIVGSYQGMRRDTLVLIEDGTGAKIWAFNTAAVSQVEVSVGMKGGNRDPMIRWGLIGAALGGGIAFITSVSLENNSGQQYNQLLSTLVGAAMGGGLGAFYGSRKLAEHWAPVPLPRRVGVVPTAKGLRITVSASF